MTSVSSARRLYNTALPKAPEMENKYSYGLKFCHNSGMMVTFEYNDVMNETWLLFFLFDSKPSK